MRNIEELGNEPAGFWCAFADTTKQINWIRIDACNACGFDNGTKHTAACRSSNSASSKPVSTVMQMAIDVSFQGEVNIGTLQILAENIALA